MAKITCTLKEFTYFIDPRVRINVANMTRQSKSLLDYKCQKCNEKKELDAAHKHGSSRPEIIRNILNDYKTNDGEYEINDLQKIIDEINTAHIPIEDHFIFLCKTCHKEYDSWTRNLIYTQPKDGNNKKSYNTQPSKSQESKISSNPDGSNNPAEILCQDETLSWKYKLGWTSIQNRKNIEEIISKIESSFDCQPVAFKSWYYHNKKSSNKQFSGIMCHKDRSVICFRVDPSSFSFADERIIHGKRWFFSEGKEKRIEIIPENYELILKCLDYSYKIS